MPLRSRMLDPREADAAAQEIAKELGSILPGIDRRIQTISFCMRLSFSLGTISPVVYDQLRSAVMRFDFAGKNTVQSLSMTGWITALQRVRVDVVRRSSAIPASHRP